MKKMITGILTAVCIAAAMTSTAFAGQWRQDYRGWWYDNGDGTWQNRGWFQDVDGKYYYFDADGYMLANTMTPDGYYVNASGVWQPGVQQTSSVMDGIYYGDLKGYTDAYGGIRGVSVSGNQLNISGVLEFDPDTGYAGRNAVDDNYLFILDGNTQYLVSYGSDYGYVNTSKENFIGTMMNFNGLGLEIRLEQGVVKSMKFIS